MKVFLLIIFNVNYIVLARAFLMYFRTVKRPDFDYQKPYESIHKMNVFEVKENILHAVVILVSLYFNYLILK